MFSLSKRNSNPDFLLGDKIGMDLPEPDALPVTSDNTGSLFMDANKNHEAETPEL